MHRAKTLIFLPLAVLAAFSAAQSRREPERPLRQPVRGVHGAVAAGSEYATEAGMRMYYQGGNAVDAGVATMFAASVTELSHFGMGGEAPILIRTKDGKVHSIAGVGTMPKLATAEMFRKRPLQPSKFASATRGGFKGIIPVAGLMPALVPGMMDARAARAARIRHQVVRAGDRPRHRTRRRIRASMRCAPSPSPYSQPFFDLWPTSKAHFLPERPRRCDRRNFPPAGSGAHAALHGGSGKESAGRRRDRARPRSTRCAIISIAAKSPTKSTRSARPTAACCATRTWPRSRFSPRNRFPPHSRLPRLQARFLEPGPGDDRDPEHSGGFDDQPAYNSAAYIHRVVEALKLAYADRDTYYGDPKFNHIPADVLLSKEYARRTPQADRRQSFAGISARHDSRQDRAQHPSEEAWRTSRSTPC